MQIYIPTFGRADRQHTYEHLPKSVRENTTLVVQHREKGLYKNYPHVVLPPSITTIAPTRKYIIEKIATTNRVLMLDDDLRFDYRRMDEQGKFYVATEQQIEVMIDTIATALLGYAHVGVLAREGGNRILTSTVQCSRMMRVLGYRRDTLRKEKIQMARIETMEDFDVTLQLLRKGYPNLVLCQWVNGQGTSGAKGGCSHFRTLEMHNANALKLAEFHAPFVTVVEKQTKGAWGGQKRLDVMVKWKKAFESSKVREVV